jgi:hypothetical protein
LGVPVIYGLSSPPFEPVYTRIPLEKNAAKVSRNNNNNDNNNAL